MTSQQCCPRATSAISLSTFSHGVPNPDASQKGVVLDQPFRYPHVRSVNLDTGSRHGDEPREKALQSTNLDELIRALPRSLIDRNPFSTLVRKRGTSAKTSH